MNREQRRQASKGQDDQRIDITGLVVHFANGQYVNLDTNKVQVIDKDTGRPLFQEILEPIPAQIEGRGNSADIATPSQEFPEDPAQVYQVSFDTPEGRMVYVKNGNWSGVRPAKEGE